MKQAEGFRRSEPGFGFAAGCLKASICSNSTGAISKNRRTHSDSGRFDRPPRFTSVPRHLGTSRYAQCGGQQWTGLTKCQSGSSCLAGRPSASSEVFWSCPLLGTRILVGPPTQRPKHQLLFFFFFFEPPTKESPSGRLMFFFCLTPKAQARRVSEKGRRPEAEPKKKP